ncbi:MAG: protoporphyrinogen oxidase [Acidobacteria bacterium]|nr:MAG: protoporphyrinogen oxidase [Acidobacteriota bacterium]
MPVAEAGVAVVGGGITGLAVAYELTAAGAPFTLFEAQPRWGGVIRTERADGFLVEAGPDSILAQKPDGIALCRELGLGDQLVPTTLPRTVYVLHRGRLHPLPEGVLGIPTRIGPLLRTRLFSWPGKLRMGLDLVLPRGGGGDESIAAFLRRRLGPEAVQRLGEPLLAGIHAGDPERLSLKATFPRFAHLEARHRSLIRGFRAARDADAASAGSSAFLSLKHGLGALVEALVQRVPPAALRTGVAVASVARAVGRFRLELAGGGSAEAAAVVLCVPAPRAASLLAGEDSELAGLLSAIPFVSTATVLLGYRRSDVAHPLDGHGLVVPRREGLRTSACSFFSSKFAGRAPDGHVLLRAFLGGRRDPEAVARDDASLLTTVREEMGPLLGLRGAPVLARVYRWPAGTPQLEVGHLDRMARIEARLAGRPGLFLAGAGLRGTGLPDCIGDGRAAAAAALRLIGGCASGAPSGSG